MCVCERERVCVRACVCVCAGEKEHSVLSQRACSGLRDLLGPLSDSLETI